MCEAQYPSPQTFETEHRACESASDRAVVRVVLLPEVCGGVLGEHVCSAHSSCASSQCRPLSQFHVFSKYTKDANGASRAGENAPRARVLLRECVLYCAYKEPCASGDCNSFHGMPERVFGGVVIGALVQRGGHFRGV